jgi:probable HAF family extracellular repeat protein
MITGTKITTDTLTSRRRFLIGSGGPILPILDPRKETMKIRLLLALAGLAISFALPIFAQQTNTPDTDKVLFKFRDITNADDPTFNQELGINNAGVIAGYFGSGAAGHPNKGYTVVRPYNTQLDFTNENFPGSVQTQVIGINNRDGLGFDRVFRGTTVGFWSNMNNANMVNNNFGFVNIGGQDGRFINVNNPNTGTINGVNTNQLLGVNDRNIAVGFYVDTAGATHGYTYDIAANTFSANIDDPNGVGATTAAAINDRGQIVGFYTDGNGVTHGFFESDGVFKTIDAANAMATSLFGLNNFGEAVGFDIDTNGAMHGIICHVVTGACEEQDDPNGIGTTTFNGLNDRGQIVGFYVNGAGNTIGLLATPQRKEPDGDN